MLEAGRLITTDRSTWNYCFVRRNWHRVWDAAIMSVESNTKSTPRTFSPLSVVFTVLAEVPYFTAVEL